VKQKLSITNIQTVMRVVAQKGEKSRVTVSGRISQTHRLDCAPGRFRASTPVLTTSYFSFTVLRTFRMVRVHGFFLTCSAFPRLLPISHHVVPRFLLRYSILRLTLLRPCSKLCCLIILSSLIPSCHTFLFSFYSAPPLFSAFVYKMLTSS
jgi:hypothetical protein